MTKFKIKRHTLNYYTLIGFLLIFYSLAGTLFVMGSFHDNFLGSTRYMLFMFGVLSYAFGAYNLCQYWYSAPTISLNGECITIRRKKIQLAEVKELILHGKVRPKYFKNAPREGMTILLKNNEKIELLDDLYQNLGDFKFFLIQKLSSSEENVPVINENIRIASVIESQESLGGNLIKSFAGIFFWVPLILSTILAVFFAIAESKEGILLFSTFAIIWFSFNSFQLYYFEISGPYLIVKNHIYFWLHMSYHFKNIKEVVIERSEVSFNALRIIKTDLNSYLFRAGSLNQKHWQNLKNALEEKGVKIRDEINL